MTRKNIFQIIAENNNDIALDSDRLVQLFEDDYLIEYSNENYSLHEFVDSRCFADWKHKGRCLNAYDCLDVLNFYSIKQEASIKIDALLTLIEVIYNFWYMAERQLGKDPIHSTSSPNFYLLRDYMQECLARYNHIAVVREDEQMVLVIEDKPEITAAAEISDPKIAVGILKYNHRLLKGDIDTKKTILLNLASDLEPKRKNLRTINRKLEEMIFILLNNMNLRHNNITKGDKNYRESVAKMCNDTLEKWYDELYQLILLAILELDNVKRMDKLEQLKTMICP